MGLLNMSMNLQIRTYCDAGDLMLINALLSAGSAAGLPCYYIHTGDLSWWLHSPLMSEADRAEVLRLWFAGDKLMAWGIFEDNSFDFFVHPEIYGSDAHGKLLQLMQAEVTRTQQNAVRKTSWISPEDTFLNGFFASHGYQRATDHYVHLRRTLGEDAGAPLPAGYVLRYCSDATGVLARSQALHGAFGSQRPWEPYLARVRTFSQTPVFVPANNLVIVAPDGRGAAACTVWTDVDSGVGLFEPVGTHPDFQGKGLGKALMAAGLRRLREAGMRSAIVSTPHDNAAAIGLYLVAGFELSFEFVTWQTGVQIQ
jgi:GNAT superfamily N-acetyltransferase